MDESEIRHERYHVVDSTAQGDTIWYVMEFEERTEQNRLIRRDTVYIGYEESTASIRGGASILGWLRCLDSPFRPTNPGSFDCWPFVGQDELFFPDLFGPEPVTAKGFASFVWAFSTVHGVGIISGGGGCEPCGPLDDRDDWWLKYARIGDEIYGGQIVSTERNSVIETPRLVAYPNPTSGPLTLEAPGGQQLEIYDIVGRRVRIEQLDESGRMLLDLSNLASGVYVLKVGLESQMVILR